MLFIIAKYVSFVTIVKTVTDMLCYKDLYLVTITKVISSVNKHLQSMISVVQTKQAAYVITLV